VLLAGVASVVGCLVAVGVVAVARAGADVDRCAAFVAQAHDRAEPFGAGPELVVIGDSYSVGLGVGPEESWPHRLDGRVRVAGFSGSGFSRSASPCGDRSFARRTGAVDEGATVVVLQGGLNDHDQPPAAVEDGLRRALAGLAGHRVVIVGPPSAPVRAATVPAVDGVLARVAAEHDVAYLSMLGAELPYLDDGLHLTPDGHRAFGDAVARFLASASPG
jgi:acyl-CoA thioesterase-1